MGHSNNKITKDGGLCPIRDVSIVLGLPTPSGDWGYLCSNAHGHTNKWAKYKPEAIGTQKDLTLDQRKANNFGLDLGSLLVTSNPIDETWRSQLVSYIPPKDFKWQRLGDFIGYNHNAQPPVSPSPDIILSPLNTTGTVFFSNIGLSQNDDISLVEFKTLLGFYPCVVVSFTRNGSTSYMYKTADKTFGESTGSILLEITRDEISKIVGTGFKFYMCGFSSKKTTFEATNVAGQFINLPSDEKLEGAISIEGASSSITLITTGVSGTTLLASGERALFLDPSSFAHMATDGTYNALAVGNNGHVNAKFTVRNFSSSAVALTASNLFFQPIGGLSGSTASGMKAPIGGLFTLNGNTPTQVSSVTVSANSEVEVAMSFPYAAIKTDSGGTIFDTAESGYLTVNLYMGTGSSDNIGSFSIFVKKL